MASYVNAVLYLRLFPRELNGMLAVRRCGPAHCRPPHGSRPQAGVLWAGTHWRPAVGLHLACKPQAASGPASAPSTL